MDDHETIEEDLIRRCRKADRQAQHEVYMRTAPRIHGLLVRMTDNTDDAFDLAQNTYVQAFRHIDQYTGQSPFFTWLYRIAVNEALQFMRRRNRSRVHLQAWSDRACPDEGADPSERVTTKLDVESALASLSPLDRTVLLLCYQEGLDYRAMADILGCSMGTVASRLNRARQRAREILQSGYAHLEEAAAAEHPN